MWGRLTWVLANPIIRGRGGSWLSVPPLSPAVHPAQAIAPLPGRVHLIIFPVTMTSSGRARVALAAAVLALSSLCSAVLGCGLIPKISAPAVEVVAVSSPVVTTKTVTVSKTVSVKKTTIKIVPELPSCSGASVAVAIMHGGNVLHDWSYITGPTTFSGVPVEGCTLKYKPVCGSKNCCGAEKTVSVTKSVTQSKSYSVTTTSSGYGTGSASGTSGYGTTGTVGTGAGTTGVGYGTTGTSYGTTGAGYGTTGTGYGTTGTWMGIDP